MGKNTEISWADHTWNPWQGCKKVSPGCKNCYMFRDKKRYGQDPSKIIRSSDKTFNLPLSKKWKEPAKVFTCSWSDFFLEEADKWRDEAWDIIKKTPHLTYLILTKRPENIFDRLPDEWHTKGHYKNVWLGVTTESQEAVSTKIPILLEIDAEIHFVSAEPLLEEIDFTEIYLNGPDISHNLLTGIPYDYDYGMYMRDNSINKVDWVICGGESGPGFREMNELWAKYLHYQCLKSKTPFFFKQMSGNNPKKIEIPGILNVKEFPE